MGIYKYISEKWKNPRVGLGDLWQTRLVEWRKEPVTVRIEHPTRLDKARALGFKAKEGYIIVRQRVEKGGRQRPKIRKARRSKARRQRKIVGLNYQSIAERRANRKYVNCEVLNSYWVAEDALHIWHEVILVDKAHPAILADRKIKWVAFPQNRARAFRGLTSAARKSRGLRNKGKGSEKSRPSLRSHGRRAH
ncbi:MAG: 50S ribosomal protein L15e [archaeon]